MNANERFEYMAEQFYKKTGMLAPGKDCPAALARSEEDMHKTYKEWAIFTEQFHANLFQTHSDMYEMLDSWLLCLKRKEESLEIEFTKQDIEDIESILKRARGE